MSRWGPQVLPQAPDFGGMLSQALQTYVQARDRKRYIQRQDSADASAQSMENLQLALQGVHRGAQPTESLPESPLVSALNIKADPMFAAMPSAQSKIAANTTRPQVAKPGTRALTPDFYQVEAETPQARQVAFQEMGRDRKRAALREAGVPDNMIEASIDNPNLTTDILKPATPDRGAQIRARITQLTTGGMPIEKANTQARLEFGEQNAAAPSDISPTVRFHADQKNKIIDDFARDTKKFDDVMGGWEVLTGALKDPSLATPFALADAYARVSNPGAIVRPSTMQMIEDLGSLDQRVRKFATKNVNGQLPPDITRDIVRTIMGMVQEHKRTFDRIRAAALKRGQQEGVTDLDGILQNFDVQDPTAPAARNADEILRQHGIAASAGVKVVP